MSIRAVETARHCDVLYFENYTSYYNDSVDKLKKFLGKNIVEVGRSDLEEKSKKIIEETKNKKVGILVIGDALSATTHNVLLMECIEKGIEYEVIHGSSIFTAVAETGLSLYKFGNTTSIPFDNENIETPYVVLEENRNMHTLILLDLKDGKYMDVKEAVDYLLRIEKKRKDAVFNEDRLCIACFSLGSDKKEIYAGAAKDIVRIKSKKYPQCLIIPGKMNFVEEEFLNNYRM